MFGLLESELRKLRDFWKPSVSFRFHERSGRMIHMELAKKIDRWPAYYVFSVTNMDKLFAFPQTSTRPLG